MRRLNVRNIRPDRDAFKNLVAAVPSTTPLLGLTHITTGYILREVLDTNSIRALEPCKYLGEPLVYAFYGRAAFRRGGDEKPTDLAFRMPVVFVLDPTKVPKPRYAFAFDSGAFVDGFFDDYLDPYMPLFDFHLEPDVATGARIASYFYGGSEGYLLNEPRAGTTIPPNVFEGQSYQKLLSGGGRANSNQLDDRTTTVEFLFDKPIDIRSTVKGAVMPAPIAESEELGKRLISDGIRVDKYEWTPVSRPSEYHMLIRSIVVGMYKDFGWL